MATSPEEASKRTRPASAALLGLLLTFSHYGTHWIHIAAYIFWRWPLAPHLAVP